MARLQPTLIPEVHVIVTAQVGVNSAAVFQGCWPRTGSGMGGLCPEQAGETDIAAGRCTARSPSQGRVADAAGRLWTAPARKTTPARKHNRPFRCTLLQTRSAHRARMSNKVIGDVDQNRPEATLGQSR
jgi:hypothetical protein